MKESTNDDEEKLKQEEIMTFKERMNKITTLLNELDQNYQVKWWESMEGMDIILNKIVIVLYDTGGVDFEWRKEYEKQ